MTEENSEPIRTIKSNNSELINSNKSSGDNLVNEFKTKFGSQPVRIEKFAITQKAEIDRLTEQIIKMRSLVEDEAHFYAHIYQFVISEGLFTSTVLDFIEDLTTICQEFGYPIEKNPYDEIIEKAVTPFIQALLFMSNINYDLSTYLIQRVSQGWEEQLAQSYALNDFLKPLVVTLIDKFPNVSLRFIAALAWASFQRYSTRKVTNDPTKKFKPQSLNEIYQYVCAEYPDVKDKIYAYDIAYKYVLKPNWHHFMDMISEEVEKLQTQLKQDKEVMRKEVESRKASEKRALRATDAYNNQVSVNLFELFKFNQEITPAKVDTIIKAFSGMMRRVAIEKWGYVAVEGGNVSIFKQEVEDYLWPELTDFPIIIAKAFGVPPKSKFYEPHRVNKTFDQVWEEFQQDPSVIENYKQKFSEELFRGFTGGANFDLIAQNLVNILKRAKSVN